MTLIKASARLHNALLGRGRGIFSNRGSKISVGFTYNSLFQQGHSVPLHLGQSYVLFPLQLLTLEFNAMRKHFLPTSPNWEVGVNSLLS